LWEIAIWDMGSRWYDNIEWIKRKYIIRLDWQIQVRNPAGFWFEQCWIFEFCYFSLSPVCNDLEFVMYHTLFNNDIITWYILHYLLLHLCYNCIKYTYSFLWFSNICLARASFLSLPYFKLHVFASELLVFILLFCSQVTLFGSSLYHC
jgi:hypothetical protein